ncbi:helix-turn-helix transcriptional regulator [Streptantibioticus parmotrematis]|uniref:helix-turn-helix domain-containing protein n=1 Tax=Streptantibioticus parmotrematis TaxID=2873249 RepID=UPI0033C93BD6
MPQIPGQGGRNEDPADELVRSFGRQFKIFRERAGLTQAELGEQLGYGEAQIASIEQGRRIARPQTIDRADELLGAGGVLTARKKELALARYPTFFRGAARIEEEAAEYHQYECLVVPGMLQTEEYARTLLALWRPRWTDTEIEEMVMARLTRQAFFDHKPARTGSFVLEEALLHRPLGSKQVLRGQLEQLLLFGNHPNIEVQVMPTQVADHTCLDGPFTLMTPRDGDQVAYLESHGNGRVIANRETVRGFAVRYGILRAQAMSPDRSLRHIEKLLQGEL